MTPHQFAAILLRLFALWLLCTASQIAILTYSVHRVGPESSAASYAMAALYFSGALLLWRFPFLIARRILSPSKTIATSGSVSAGDGAAVAFVSVGLLVIALKALTPVANYLSFITMLIVSGQEDRLFTPSLHIDGVVGMVMLLIGLAMIVKSRAMGHRLLASLSD